MFRDHDAEDGSKVTFIELFFDLVFVFAITQLSHRLLNHFTVGGAIETLLLLLTVWWLWMYTSWATNWLDPEQPLVRLLLMTMMLGGLLLASAIPDAFDKHSLMFVAVYLVLQVARSLFIVWASMPEHPDRARNFWRIIFYFALSSPFWVYGAWQQTWSVRLLCWSIALCIEYAGPFLMFRTPGLGRSKASDWDISGLHMSERCSLFIIIALGEALLITGATYAKVDQDVTVHVAFVSCVIGSAAMWWIYFDTGAKRGGEAIEASEDTGLLARNAYTYLHLPIVAGVVVTAVGDQMVLAYPAAQGVGGFILVACGGPLLFLVGNQAFKWLTGRYKIPPLSHSIGIVGMIVIAAMAWRSGWPPVTIAAAATAMLVITATWEWFSLNGGWRRWAPWLDRRTAIALEQSER